MTRSRRLRRPWQLARGTMRGKIRRLEQALDCSFFTAEHAAVLAMMLTTIDHYTTQIEALTARIEALIEPCLRQVEQLDAVHGIGPAGAQDVIAEIGTTMTAFPTAAHLVSWARWSPQITQSAGRRKGSNATGRGNPYLSAALGEAATGADRPLRRGLHHPRQADPTRAERRIRRAEMRSVYDGVRRRPRGI